MRQRNQISRRRRADITDAAHQIFSRGRSNGLSTDQVQAELLRAFPGELMPGEARMYAMGWTVRVVREGLRALATHDGLDAAGLGDTEVWRWLRGEVRPRDWLPRLCRLFKCHQSQLGWPPQGNEPTIDHTATTDERNGAASAPTITLSHSERATADTVDVIESMDNGPWAYRTTEARMLDAARRHYEQMYRETGGVKTGARVQAVITAVRYIADQAYSDAAGREVYRALGGLIAIAGICAYDSDSHDAAEALYRRALSLARASGDRAFGAYVYGLLGTRALVLGRNSDAVDAAEVAVATAGRHLSPALRADLRALQAKAFARIGANDRAVHSMRLAEAAASQIRPAEEPPETGYVQPGLIEEQLADALRTMGDLSGALSYAERSVRMATHTRGRANRLVILAQIVIARGDLEYGADAVRNLLRATEAIESRRFHDRLQTIRQSVARHRASAAARDVVDELDSRLVLPTTRR